MCGLSINLLTRWVALSIIDRGDLMFLRVICGWIYCFFRCMKGNSWKEATCYSDLSIRLSTDGNFSQLWAHWNREFGVVYVFSAHGHSRLALKINYHLYFLRWEMGTSTSFLPYAFNVLLPSTYVHIAAYGQDKLSLLSVCGLSLTSSHNVLILMSTLPDVYIIIPDFISIALNDGVVSWDHF